MRTTISAYPIYSLLGRRHFLYGGLAIVTAAVATTAGSRLAFAYDFTLYNDARNRRVHVTRRARTNRVECVVEEKNDHGVWKPVSDVAVLVRPQDETGRFDEETTDGDGKTLHSGYSYTSGMRVNVKAEGIPIGLGVLI